MKARVTLYAEHTPVPGPGVLTDEEPWSTDGSPVFFLWLTEDDPKGTEDAVRAYEIAAEYIMVVHGPRAEVQGLFDAAREAGFNVAWPEDVRID